VVGHRAARARQEGGRGGRPPPVTRWALSNERPYREHGGVGVSAWYMVQARSVGWRWNEFLPVLHHLQHP
jgi:hypothetical protein